MDGRPQGTRRGGLAWLAAGLLALGCQNNRYAQDLLERDLRLQEDLIFELEADLREAERKLELCRGQSSREEGGDTSGARSGSTRTPGPRSTGGEPPRSTIPSDAPSSPAGDPLAPPKITLPGEQAPAFQGPPAILPPDSSVPEGIRGPTPPSGTAPGGAASPGSGAPTAPGGSTPMPMGIPNLPPTPPPIAPPGGSRSSGLPPFPDTEPSADQTAASSAPGGPTVATVTLNLAGTRGFNADQLPGDDGITVVLEPRDAAGAPLRVPGEVSIVALDPTKDGDAARVARWDFAPEEALRFYQPESAGGGMAFKLRWPRGTPQADNLALFARFTTADGQRLVADGQIPIDPGSPPSTVEFRGAPSASGTGPLAGPPGSPPRSGLPAPPRPTSGPPSAWSRAPAGRARLMPPQEVPRAAAPRSGPASPPGVEALRPVPRTAPPAQLGPPPGSTPATLSGRPSWSPYR